MRQPALGSHGWIYEDEVDKKKGGKKNKESNKKEGTAS
jgi:hypothetical protein